MSTPYPAPPPPPPPSGPAAAAPWYKKPGPLFLLGLVIAAAIAIPVVLLMLGGDDEESAVSTSTTAAVTTTAGVTTTAAVTTTAGVTTTTAGVTTTAATTTTSGDSPCGDPELDALYQDCADGDMQACDDLYMESPAGSECEAFGDTCGGTTSGGTWCTGSPPTTTSGAGDVLDYTLTALFADNVDLPGGFTPDPATWWVEAGGPVDVDELGEPTCSGWATQAPSVEVIYSGGGGPLLRFYFEADNPDDDTVLIVSDASGNWVCDDDYDYGAGILDPSVDITDPGDGTYDVWVASYHEGETVSGTLYITELDGNHP